MHKITLAAAALLAATQADAALITSLPGGQSANIPVANKMSAGPELFGSTLSPITFTATQNMAVFGWTGSYNSFDYEWAAGGAPIIANNILTASTVTLRSRRRSPRSSPR